MDAERRQRYLDKMAHARERLGDVQAWWQGVEESKMQRLACYKAMQEAVEAMTDLLAMALRDADRQPRDDYSNIEALQHADRLSPEGAETLAEANGLRNRLVHEYNGLWDDVAIERIGALAPRLVDVLEEVEAWI